MLLQMLQCQRMVKVQSIINYLIMHNNIILEFYGGPMCVRARRNLYYQLQVESNYTVHVCYNNNEEWTLFFSHSVRTMTSGTTIYIGRYIHIRISNILSFFTCCETSGRPTSRVQRGDVFWKKSDLATSVFFISNYLFCWFFGF